MARGVGLLLLVTVLALVLGTVIPRGGDDRSETSNRRVFVISNAIHTDIALPLDAETRAVFGFLEANGMPIARPDAKWLLFGWGGEQFYVRTPTWADLEWLPVLRSLVGDRSVLHVGLTGRIDPEAPYVKAVDLSEAGYAALVASIRASFVEGDVRPPAALAVPGYGEFDRFFPAEGRFQAFFGCNTWTGEMLRAAGVTTGAWTPLPFLLRLSIDLHG